MVVYFILVSMKKKKSHLVVDSFFVLVYIFIMLIFLFPSSISFLEKTLGIQSAINFIIYLSIFIAYFIIFILYTIIDDQRKQITALTREVALSNYKKEQSEHKKK
ncbi:DUF2304 domain-containing protein [Candidatus Woesearchaeota archaeon]|nr:DUF2304 domain-containing protein [Candidatus Woesearchaeota archaeon]